MVKKKKKKKNEFKCFPCLQQKFKQARVICHAYKNGKGRKISNEKDEDSGYFVYNGKKAFHILK